MMHNRTRCVQLAALWLAGCGGSDGLVDEPALALGAGQSEIVGGEVDRADEHSAVLAIAALDQRSVALCSGTLLAPNLVLTARHCVTQVPDEAIDCRSASTSEAFRARRLGVSASTSVQGGAPFYPVAEVLVREENELCGNDIALLVLGGRFTNLVAIEPRLQEPVLGGESLTAVGYGDALVADSAGLRRVREGLRVLCSDDRCGLPDAIVQNEFAGDGGVCTGDSGGPALDAAGHVMGVASRGDEDCGLSIYTSVPALSGWLVEETLEAAQRGGFQAPDWALAFADGDSLSAGEAATVQGDVSEPGAALSSPDAELVDEDTATVGPEAAEGIDLSPDAESARGGCALSWPGRGQQAGAASLVMAFLALAMRRSKRVA